MNDGLSLAALIAAIKLYGLKAVLGMLGTTLLFLALPPEDKDGKLNKREFFFRLLSAGMASSFLGDIAVDFLVNRYPTMSFDHHRAAIYLLVGAPAWIATRAIALWLNKIKNKDIVEIAQEVKSGISKDV